MKTHETHLIGCGILDSRENSIVTKVFVSSVDMPTIRWELVGHKTHHYG